MISFCYDMYQNWLKKLKNLSNINIEMKSESKAHIKIHLGEPGSCLIGEKICFIYRNFW